MQLTGKMFSQVTDFNSILGKKKVKLITFFFYLKNRVKEFSLTISKKR